MTNRTNTTNNIIATMNHFVYGSDNELSYDSIMKSANELLPQSAPSKIKYANANYTRKLTDGSMELLVQSQVVVALVKKYLYKLYSLGNMNALELLNGSNGVISIEDLISSAYASLYKNMGKWYFNYFTGELFMNEQTRKDFYSAISNELYQFKTRVFKREFVSVYVTTGNESALEEEKIVLANVSNLRVQDADSLGAMLNLEELRDFMKTYNGNKYLAKQIITLRALGYSLSEIANKVGEQYTLGHVNAENTKLQRAWKKLHARPTHKHAPVVYNYSWKYRTSTMDKIIEERDKTRKEKIKAHTIKNKGTRKLSELEKFAYNPNTYITKFNDKGVLADSVSRLDKKINDRKMLGLSMLNN